ncbi:MAG TPA: hypothetical protein VM283_05645, partial [Armatimonadota bacterium]|nr:hypothetical protein [Armatimonadota bacterium]
MDQPARGVWGIAVLLALTAVAAAWGQTPPAERTALLAARSMSYAEQMYAPERSLVVDEWGRPSVGYSVGYVVATLIRGAATEQAN